MPTPGKHQLRATPAQIVEHLLGQHGEELKAQREQIALQTKVLEELGKKVEEQGKLFEALIAKSQEVNTQISALQGQIIGMEHHLEESAKERATAAAQATPEVEVIGSPTPNPRAVAPRPAAPRAETAPTVEPGPSENAPADELAEGEAEAPTPGGQIHVVGKGETLGNIARKYNVTVENLMKHNEIKDPRKLQAGQDLFIP